MLDVLKKSPALRVFEEAVRARKSVLVEGLWDAPKAALAALIAKELGRSILLITGGTREDRLFDNLSYFDRTLPIEFPAWETLPGEEIAPSPDILGKRFEALHTLLHKASPSVVLCPLPALLQKVLAPNALAPLLSTWKIGSEIPFDTLDERLTHLGYKRCPVVSDKGQFALRGGILDLFPVSSYDPFRIEFFENRIESIRTFDPVGQKSIAKAKEIFVSPAVELPFLQKASRLASIADYLKEETLVIWDDLLAIEDTYVAIQQMPGAKSPFFYSLETLLKRFEQQLFFSSETIETMSPTIQIKERSRHLQSIVFESLNHTFSADRWFHPFQKVEPFLTLEEPMPESMELIFFSENKTEEEEIKKQIAALPLPKQIHFETGFLTSGFFVSDLLTAWIPYAELTHRSRIRRQKWRNTYHTPAAEFHELTPGDLVVHFHSGIGRYLGMEKHTNHLGLETEFLSLQYAEGSKLFVPLSQAYLVSRYIGSKEELPHLSQLGSKRWQTIRANAQAHIVGYAHDLLHMVAERVVRGGFQYPPDSDLMRQFERDFPYVETQDQLLAIQAIKEDMMSSKAMDRLICGDVGYGKTEVAMRAAFKAVADGGKQVAVLVPTTVLAMQHVETFSNRMKGFPIKIGIVSRFQSLKEAKKILERLETGDIDILVGTHRLLSKDVKFKDLGLIIIDEEQRFGVRSKEHLKKLKLGVDCLTLSATPIPRTLYLSLVHARDMSVINTPPQDRLPIKCILAETDPELIQNALMREFSRGGQAFFIHNRVETIHEKAQAIQKLLPALRIGIVHGQMDADDIDQVFHRFKQGEIDLLFATTIVENGIDIPNANTILIDRADTHGLADLYQLRGRVGRWNRSAYAYFLIPKQARLSDISRKRLSALVEAKSYGAGMNIAMRDLEIRGAGDILGVQQSGQVSSVGFHLYCKMLKKAIDALKNKQPISFTETKMEMPFDARLPDFYIDDVSLRMEIYHRWGEATSSAEVDAIFAELSDRFGQPPEPVVWLYHLTRLRVFAAAKHFVLLKCNQLSLTAEQLIGKESRTKTIVLPKKAQTPAAFELYVTEKLY